MKKLRNFMRGFTYHIMNMMYNIDNDILRIAFKTITYVFIMPILIISSYILFVPLLIRYGKNARKMDKEEQIEWYNNKLKKIQEPE